MNVDQSVARIRKDKFESRAKVLAKSESHPGRCDLRLTLAL